MNEAYSIEESVTPAGARIVAIGVGGGGGNMIGHMISEGVSGIELAIANTDAQVLEKSHAATKIQIGAKLTRGLGAGMKPDVGKDSALESYDEIKNALIGADIVFIAAGLGGGTGTGAAPIIAQIAKEVGALTISVVTKPFSYEGRKRMKLAMAGLEELKKESDSIVIIPNDKLLSIIDRNLGMRESFKIVDTVLAEAVSGTSGVILSEGTINVDFADFQTVMSHRGMALMGIGSHKGENAAYEAIKSAIESPLLDNMSINGALGVLVNFHMHPDYSMMSITEAMNVINDSADEDAEVIFGVSNDDTLELDEIKVTLIATGFEKDVDVGVNNNEYVNETVVQESPVVSRPKLVMNGENEDFLDVPTFMRQQKD